MVYQKNTAIIYHLNYISMKLKRKLWISPFIVGALLFLTIHSCKKDESLDPVVPVVSTTIVSEIAQTSAKCSSNIEKDGGAKVTERGICWNTVENPLIENNKVSGGTGIGDFTIDLSNLTPNTTYYIRAYASNIVGTSYGKQVIFKTEPEAPNAGPVVISDITKVSASCSANIINDGGSPVTARGICWSTTINPHIALTTKTTNGNGTGSFSSSITNLTAATTYYVRAYATNSLGTSYGNNTLFTTLAPDPPTVTSTLLDISGGVSAILYSNVSNDGGANVTARGAVWSTTTNPHIGLTTKTIDGAGTGQFTSTATGLEPNTKYYIRAFATNSAGTSYGQESNFTTNAGTPAIGTTAVSSIGETAATCNVKISNDGGSAVTERGVCWSKATNPHTGLTTKTANGTGKANFLAFITGLTSNTTYYVRAYATNSIGTTYSNQIEIKTTQPISDNEGNSYKTVVIGTQTWMAENLKVTKYKNGDLIGTTATPAEDLTGTSSPKYQWPPNKSESNVATYGRLYTYYVVTDSRGVCPAGWHIPTKDELSTMVYYLKNNGHNDNLYSGNQIGPAMASESNWAYYSAIGSIGQVTNRNSSGFNGKPAGYRLDNGVYFSITKANAIWSSSKYNSSNFYYLDLEYQYNFVDVKYAGITLYGFSARCLKD